MKRIWGLFSSIWLTVVLAVLICLVAALGSLESLKSPEVFSYLDRVVLLDGLKGLPPEVLGRVYWIFLLIILIFLFSINTLVCTADRVSSIVKRGGPWRGLFPHIVHIGFLVAVAGHLAGSLWGFRTSGNILYSGELTAVPYVKDLSIRLDKVDAREDARGNLDYLKTKVTLFKGGKKAVAGEIRLNAPLIYRGIAFYHTNQGSVPGGLVLRAGGAEKRVPFYGSFNIPGAGKIRLGEIYPDLAKDEKGAPYSRSKEFRNPFVEIESDGAERAFLNISRPGERVRLGPLEVELVDYIMRPYAVLMINRDPGIALVMAGSAILVIGMALLLFFRGERGEIVRRPGASKQ
ncbi:MAG: cytochrome c biogenesis protein ResB [Thermodesulfobacteriota bacterium]